MSKNNPTREQPTAGCSKLVFLAHVALDAPGGFSLIMIHANLTEQRDIAQIYIQIMNKRNEIISDTDNEATLQKIRPDQIIFWLQLLCSPCYTDYRTALKFCFENQKKISIDGIGPNSVAGSGIYKKTQIKIKNVCR